MLRSLVYEAGDTIIYFGTIYGSCEKTVSYITETTPATSHRIEFTYPISDNELCGLFEQAISSLKSAGKTPRLAIIDTITSLPGIRVPFATLIRICREHNVLSCVDGAHGVGHLPLDLSSLDPDFFVSNCHKWLYTPRGCAIFYVPVRNQHLIRSSLPTSHGFVPKPVEGEQVINNPLPASTKSAFVSLFEFVGTMDETAYLCIPAALEYRKNVICGALRGEEAIRKYCLRQAREAGQLMKHKFGTEILENEEKSLGGCYFSNVRLPLSYRDLAQGDRPTAIKIAQWIAQTLVREYDTFIAIIFYDDAWWVRLSAQIYLTMDDWEKGAEILVHICGRVNRKEWQ